MNFASLLRGCVKALGRDQSWPAHFDVTTRGARQSVLAVLMTLLFYFVIAVGVEAERAVVLDTDVREISLLPFFFILSIYVLMFPLVATIIGTVFGRLDRLAAWITVRHWTFFFAVLIPAAFFGLYLAGLMPFMVANTVLFFVYMASLAFDIRLAQKVAGFDWGPAIFTGCIITAMGLMVILTGTVQFLAGG